MDGEPVQLFRKEAIAYRYKTRWWTIRRQPTVSASQAALIVIAAALLLLGSFLLLLPDFRPLVL